MSPISKLFYKNYILIILIMEDLMEEFNIFWPVYKNFEEETLQLTKYINFSDDQLKVYSMHIADLIIRIVVEIEALAKELYKLNGGNDVFNENGTKRDLFFDTDCIKYLNDIWSICNREIIISCPRFNFKSEEYKIFRPLNNAHKRGTSGAKWNKAYQAVKHDRRNSLKKGNIENLIHALGALYILNIYYKDDIFKYKDSEYQNNSFDVRLGSEIFAATVIDASKASVGIDDSEKAIDDIERSKKSTALYIIKYTDEIWQNMHEEFVKYNTKIAKGLINSPEFIKGLKTKVTTPNDDIVEICKSLMEKLQKGYIQKNPPMYLARMMSKGDKEVILNKGQTIYKAST